MKTALLVLFVINIQENFNSFKQNLFYKHHTFLKSLTLINFFVDILSFLVT